MTDPSSNQGRESESCRLLSEYVLGDWNVWAIIALLFSIGVILS